MANTGVLPFVRGVDFTNNDFSVSKFVDLHTIFADSALNIPHFQGLTATLKRRLQF